MPEIKRKSQPTNPLPPEPKEDYLLQRWVEKKVELEANDGTLKTIRATVIGSALAVHPSLNGVQYSLTHVPTRLQIIAMKEAEPLVMIAEILWDSFPMAFRKKIQSEVVAAIPPWVKTWIHACRDKQAFVEPKEYKENQK